MSLFIPDRGDLVWLDFSPQAGHEHAGRRPALVISPKSYNQKTKTMLCCPLTTQIKKTPFAVQIEGKKLSFALADQIRNLDWTARKAEFMGKASFDEVEEVIGKLSTLLE